MAEAADDKICPRCHQADVDAQFYGPCPTCREELRAKYATSGGARPADREAFEPKANVTPNFVATKD